MHILSIPCIAMASVNFYVSAYYLYLYSRKRQIKEHLPFAVLCLGVGLYDLFSSGLYNSLSLSDGIFWQRLQLDTVVAICVVMIWFAGVYTLQQGNRILQFSIAWLSAIFFVSLFAPPELSLSLTNPAVKNVDLFGLLKITYYEGAVGLVYRVAMLSTAIVYVYIFSLFIRHYRGPRDRTLLLILSCQTIYFLGLVSDYLVAMRVYSFIYISEYTFFFMVLAMAYTLLNRFVNLHTAFEELNAHLTRLVDRDDLTGLYNRRFFNEYFEIETWRAKNCLEHKARLLPSPGNDMNFGLAMIDIDHFKHINDTCGHLVGDKILKEVIEIIERHTFSRDVLCRYGGDEFALLLTKTSNSGILQAAEKIRKEIDEHVFDSATDQRCNHITISMGLVTFNEILDMENEGIMKLVDDRLLRAKSMGRNRIVHDDECFLRAGPQAAEYIVEVQE